MQPSIKGMVVGISASLSIAFAAGLSIAGGSPMSWSVFGRLGPAEATIDLIVCGLPVATAFAILLSRLETPSFGPDVRTYVFVGVALLVLTLCLPLWPDLATFGMPLTILHAIALARWTAPCAVPLPRAIAL